MSAIDGFLLVAGPALIAVMLAGLMLFVRLDRRHAPRWPTVAGDAHREHWVQARQPPSLQAQRLVRGYVWAVTLITGVLALAGLIVLITA
ncbi:MAG TPA: hypothetical protein VLI06_00450 [Solimonas sp.]|nr:hypothetical protein [Solimonas sp.]